ncbi:MAG: DUF937 domain-containing protein, partial [Polyangiaceae bacterium]|nr:DUF937 domain-containing protein [Polyangiaceae bacterium]
MESNFIDKIKGSITPEMSNRVASTTGESPDKVQNAIQGAFSTILAGFAHRSERPDGASFLSQFREGGTGGGTAGEDKMRSGVGTSDMTSGGGQGLLGKIFGDRSTGVSDALAAHTGIKSSSANHILSMAAPLVASALGSSIVSQGVGGVAQMLSSHKKAALDHPNAPFGLSSILGSQPGQQESPIAARLSAHEPHEPVRATPEVRHEVPRAETPHVEKPRETPRAEPSHVERPRETPHVEKPRETPHVERPRETPRAEP